MPPQIIGTVPPWPARTPPLQNGDRLTRPEFERRYEAQPRLKKAELIEGEVFVPSPVSFVEHAQPHFNLITWLGTFIAMTKGVLGGDNASLRLDLDSEPQPDAFLLIEPRLGGQARIDGDGFVAGAPELIAEVAATSASYDLGAKLRVYLRNGAREYVVWRVFDGAIDWFALRDGEYQRLEPDEDRIVCSEILPGLWLDPAALIAGDMARVLEVQQRGLASPEAAEFRHGLAQAAAALKQR